MTEIQLVRNKLELLHSFPADLGLEVPKRGTYPSVSKILQETGDKSGLEAWRARIGNEEADKICNASKSRGTKMHTIIESHFNMEGNIQDSELGELGGKLYLTLKPFLNKITPISLETKLWSDKLKLNGRADCIGYYDNQLSVIDFKSSLKEKSVKWIGDYFIQATYYAMMIHELTAIPIHKVIILIAVERGFPQLFVGDTKDYLIEALKRVNQYHDLQSNLARETG